jgi:nifR3 family TIM-barrel protein
MRIGSLTLENPTVLAPLAGITNLPFRLLARTAGCALVCSEMVSANGLVHGSAKTARMLATVADEKPVSMQLFGSDPQITAEAAARVEAAGADVLDINFGCAVKKIVKSGAGVALMREPQKAAALLGAVRQAVRIPLTVKIRTGWEASGAQALQIARIAEDCGVDAIAVHPRTAAQAFRGCADWPVIAAVKSAVAIPVIGNGDITCAADALAMRRKTGCDAVMIGRAAIGAPWLFGQVRAALEGQAPPPVDLALRFDALRAYLRASVRFFGERHACRMMRSRLGWFSRGLPHSSAFRESIKELASEAQALEKLAAYEALLRHREAEGPGKK